MDKLLSALLIFIASFSFSQEYIELNVLDKSNQSPLPFCNVWIKGKNTGGITNADGQIRILVDSNDVLVFSYIGYKKRHITVSTWQKTKTIYLKPDSYQLNEVTVDSDNDYLYDIMMKCRDTMLLNESKRISKAHYTVATKANDTILEFLECYYNAYFKGVRLDELKFKQGRFGLARVSGNYFLTQGTSQAITQINILKNQDYFPYIPTQLKRRKLKKLFDLRLLGSTKEYLYISFKSKKGEDFNGDIYIDKKTFNIHKLSLNIQNTHHHPFMSIYGVGADGLSGFSLNLNYHFKIEENRSRLDIINFEYGFNYFSDRSQQIPPKKLTRKINSKVTLHFYDYVTQFILPYFHFEANTTGGDYTKAITIPYNDVFWNQRNKEITKSKEQKRNWHYLVENGRLVNYNDFDLKKMGFVRDTSIKNRRLWAMQYVHWEKDKRIISMSGIPSLSDLKNYRNNILNIEIQILLDITECKDSLHCRSFAVFDIPNFLYNFKKDSVSDAFINIYFDIYEIERRKMQSALDARNLSLSEIQDIYKQTVHNADSIASRYVKEVQHGHRKRYFKKWNNYIIEALGLDNVSMNIATWRDRAKRKRPKNEL